MITDKGIICDLCKKKVLVAKDCEVIVSKKSLINDGEGNQHTRFDCLPPVRWDVCEKCCIARGW